MALTLAPSHNQPTITFGSLSSGAAASTVITGSAGWFREKRVGVAETSAGASQTSTADLDLTGSTHYRYPGVPAAIGSPSNAGQYAATDLQPGAVTNSHWPFNVEMVTSSPTLAFRYNAPSTNPSLGRILVDGLPITDAVGAATATAGSGYYMLLTFPDSRARTITVMGANATQGRWGGCAVASGYSITKPTDTLGLMAIIADSYGRGAGVVGTMDTAAWRLAWELGYGRSVTLAAVGGTGIVYDGSGGATASFDGRVSMAMGLSPEAVLIFGGRNDTGGGTLQTGLESLLDAIGGTPLRVVASTASEGSQATVRSSMSAGAASRSVAYIDTTIDSLPKLDSVHPTLDGHKTLADELLAEWPSTAVDATFATMAGDGLAEGGSATTSASSTLTTTAGVAATDGGAASITATSTFTASAGDASGGGGSAGFLSASTFTSAAGTASADGGSLTLTANSTFTTVGGEAVAEGGTGAFSGAASGTFSALSGGAAGDGGNAAASASSTFSAVAGSATAEGSGATLTASAALMATAGAGIAAGGVASLGGASPATFATAAAESIASGGTASFLAAVVWATLAGTATAAGEASTFAAMNDSDWNPSPLRTHRVPAPTRTVTVAADRTHIIAATDRTVRIRRFTDG